MSTARPVETVDEISVFAPKPLPLVRRAYLYLDWLDAQAGGAPSGALAGTLAAQPGMRRRRAPGNTCLSALRAGGHGDVGRPINDSKGCGAAMRSAPVAFLSGLPVGPEAFRLGVRTGALTHGHPDGGARPASWPRRCGGCSGARGCATPWRARSAT